MLDARSNWTTVCLVAIVAAFLAFLLSPYSSLYKSDMSVGDVGTLLGAVGAMLTLFLGQKKLANDKWKEEVKSAMLMDPEKVTQHDVDSIGTTNVH